MNLPKRGQYILPRSIDTVHILGGTHGNERTGLHALQYIENHKSEFCSGDIKNINCVLANPKAVKKNTRYLEKDLNRCYQYDYTHPKAVDESPVYEMRRAFEIRQQLGALTKPADFVIDLHSTTANMGNCLIVSDNDPWTQALAEKMLNNIPNSFLIYEMVKREEEPTSSSLGMNHVTLEMGPIEQGVALHQKIKSALVHIKSIIKAVSELNHLENPRIIESQIPIYVFEKHTVDYPRDKNGIPEFYIHPDFLHRDYQPLKQGQPIFINAKGDILYLDDNGFFPADLIFAIKAGKKICPIFIGESAYVEKGIAFGLVSASFFSR